MTDPSNIERELNRIESQIIKRYLRAAKSKDLNRTAKIGYGHLLRFPIVHQQPNSVRLRVMCAKTILRLFTSPLSIRYKGV
jgi:hypothetical protein